MVMEMKQGFSTAMEELSKIQYGDQNLQQQLADNKKECSVEVTQVKDVVEELKVIKSTVDGLKFRTIVACQKGLDIQGRLRSECF